VDTYHMMFALRVRVVTVPYILI